jgi:hypothetical protein
MEFGIFFPGQERVRVIYSVISSQPSIYHMVEVNHSRRVGVKGIWALIPPLRVTRFGSRGTIHSCERDSNCADYVVAQENVLDGGRSAVQAWHFTEVDDIGAFRMKHGPRACP